MTAMLRLMGMLLCSIFVAADVMPMAGFNLQKMAGKWYMIGFATNAQWFVNHKANMKMGTTMMTPTAGGGMDLAYATANANGTCWRMTHILKKTETPGRFIFHSKRCNNYNYMLVVDANDQFALVHTIKPKGGVSEVLNKLYGRSPDARAELIEKFTQFSLETGVLADNIAILPPNDEC